MEEKLLFIDMNVVANLIVFSGLILKIMEDEYAVDGDYVQREILKDNVLFQDLVKAFRGACVDGQRILEALDKIAEEAGLHNEKTDEPKSDPS